MSPLSQVNKLKAEAIGGAMGRSLERIRRLQDAVADMLDHDGPEFTSAALANISTLINMPDSAWGRLARE
jgi:predicted methyltransferase